jgi:MFS family permease
MVTTVAKWFEKRRSVMTGIITAGIGIGALIGPPLATWLIATYGWRVSYMILGITVLTVVLVSAQVIKGDPTQMGQVAYGGRGAEDEGLKYASGGLSLKEAACTKQFWLFFGMFICFGFCLFSVMVHIVPHVIDLGISALTAAKVLATIGGTSIIAKVLLGRVGDIFGSRRVFIVSFIMMSGSLFWLVTAKVVWMLYAVAVIFGFAYGGNVVSMSPHVAALFGLSSHGFITGVMAFSFTIGGSLGPFLTGYLFDVSGSYRLAFLLWAVLGFVGLVLAVMLKSGRVRV